MDLCKFYWGNRVHNRGICELIKKKMGGQKCLYTDFLLRIQILCTLSPKNGKKDILLFVTGGVGGVKEGLQMSYFFVCLSVHLH